MKKQRSIKTFFTLVVIFTCAIIGYYAFSIIRTTRQTDAVYTFAQQLGYIPDAQIAEYRTCWDIFPSHCGQVLYYTTSINRDEFQVKIDNLALTKELAQNVSIYTLLDINLVTDHILTIDKMKDSGDRTLTPEPSAYKWRITEGGENWVITFYEVAHDEHVYKMDDQQIVGNIVTIMLQTK